MIKKIVIIILSLTIININFQFAFAEDEEPFVIDYDDVQDAKTRLQYLSNDIEDVFGNYKYEYFLLKGKGIKGNTTAKERMLARIRSAAENSSLATNNTNATEPKFKLEYLPPKYGPVITVVVVVGRYMFIYKYFYYNFGKIK